MTVEILKKKDGSFDGNDGPVTYFWYTAIRKEDNKPVRFQFGSKDGAHKEGETLDLDLFLEEKDNGRKIWKEEVEE